MNKVWLWAGALAFGLAVGKARGGAVQGSGAPGERALPGASEVWTLERALGHALAHNPDAAAARARIAAARAVQAQANAAVWPRVQVGSSYLRTDNPMLVFGSILNQRAYDRGLDFNDVPDVDNLNVRGTARVPLYAGGRIKAEKAAATANSEASRLESQSVSNILAFEVVQAYNTVLKTRQFIRAAEASVNAFEQARETAQRRLAGGTLLKTEALDLEVRLAEAREDLVRARNAQALAVRAMRNLLSLEEGAPFEVAETVPEAGVPAPGAMPLRPELLAAQQREKAAAEQVRSARAGYAPRVSAFGGVDYDYGWKMDNGGGSYQAGAMVEWDVFDGNLTRAKVRESVANLEVAREQVRRTKLALDLEVEQARLNLNALEERLRVTEQAVALANESAELTRSRFEQGLAVSTQVIDAEAALLGARVRRAEVEADRRIAVGAVRKALGLSQLENGQ